MLSCDRAHCFPIMMRISFPIATNYAELRTWMVDHGHLSIGLFDLEIRRGGLDAQDIIICRVDHHDEQELDIREMKKNKMLGRVSSSRRKNDVGVCRA